MTAVARGMPIAIADPNTISRMTSAMARPSASEPGAFCAAFMIEPLISVCTPATACDRDGVLRVGRVGGVERPHGIVNVDICGAGVCGHRVSRGVERIRDGDDVVPTGNARRVLVTAVCALADR